MDTTLRRLERDHLRSRTAETGAAMLTHRLRAGELCPTCRGVEPATGHWGGDRRAIVIAGVPLGFCPSCGCVGLRRRIRAAAYAGDPGARLVSIGEIVDKETGRVLERGPFAWALVDDWDVLETFRALAGYGQAVAVRAACAMAAVAIEREWRPAPQRKRPTALEVRSSREGLRTMHDWLELPSEDRRQTVSRVMLNRGPPGSSTDGVHALSLGVTGAPMVRRNYRSDRVLEAARIFSRIVPVPAELIAPDRRYREAIRAELVPWLLR